MALFRNTEDFARVYPALESADWSMLRPIIDTVEAADIRTRVLGTELYASLAAAFQQVQNDPPEPENAALRALFHMVRPCIAYQAAVKASRKLNTLFTSGGIQQVEPEKRAAMWAVRERRADDLGDAYIHLNLLIDFLLAKENTDYPTWANAPVRREMRGSLVPTTTIADQYIRLHGAWLLHQIRPALRDVQRGPVLTILGQAKHDDLVSKTHTSGYVFNPEEAAILDEAIPAILHGAIARSIVPLGLALDHDGVWTWAATTSGGQISGGEKPADAERIDGLIRHHRGECNSRLRALAELVSPGTAGGDNRVYSPGPITFFG